MLMMAPLPFEIMIPTSLTDTIAPVATLMSQSVCVPTGTPMLPLVAQTRALAT